MSTMIFLGAGASAADGAPIQGAMFRDYAQQYQNDNYVKLNPTAWSYERAIPRFLNDFFGIDID